MATSLIGGLLANRYEPASITACDISSQQLEQLRERFGIETAEDTLTAAQAADVVMLAVKPQVMREVCEHLSPLAVRAEQLFISIAAGMPADSIDDWLGGGRSIVRCMPNTPALLQLGASGLYANPRVSAAQKTLSMVWACW